MANNVETIRSKFQALRPIMDERLARLWAGAEAQAIGSGGIAIVERATGMSRTTIRAGRDELREGVTQQDVVKVRRAGGGRTPIEVLTPEIVPVLESLVDPVTRGDPKSPLRWTWKSTRKLSVELSGQGFASARRRLAGCCTLGYSLQATRKSRGERRTRIATPSSSTSTRLRRWFQARPAGHLGGHQEEGTGGRLQERWAGVAAEGPTRAGAGA